MNGPWHYTEAERLGQAAIEEFMDSTDGEVNPQWRLTMARAQVHAALALTAATAQAAGGEGPRLVLPDNDWGRALFGDPT